MFDAAALHSDLTMLACLFSKQLGLRFTIRMLRRAVIDLNVPLSSLDILHAANVPRLRNAFTHYTYMSDAKAMVLWLEDGKRMKEPKTWGVEARLRPYIASEDEKAIRACVVAWGNCTNLVTLVGQRRVERMYFDGGDSVFKPLVVVPSNLIREREGSRTLFSRPGCKLGRRLVV
jgi:hypothetical protein